MREFSRAPKFPKKLPGTFWGIGTFFNPAGYKNKNENYKIFRENAKQQGLNLVMVELAFENKPFELKKEDCEILVQIRGNEKNIMWQKEAMLNVGLKNVPEDCDKICWIDCDVIFENDNWIQETSSLLEEYVIVQPFTSCMIMPKNIQPQDVIINNLSVGHSVNQKNHSIAFTKEEQGSKSGHMGYAWASRREIFEDIGFYDKIIVGAGDQIIIDAFFSPVNSLSKKNYSERVFADMAVYENTLFSKVKKSVFYTSGNLFHLWHGDMKKRMYDMRLMILKNNDFDPCIDIKKNSDGILELNSDKKKLSKALRAYFYVRSEEDSVTFLNRYFLYSVRYILCKNYFPQAEIISVFFSEEKDILLGKFGSIIKKVSPALYRYLSCRKPTWAQSSVDNN